MKNVSSDKREKYRRISKARIFSGHPLKPEVHALALMAGMYALIAAVISLLFSFFHGVNLTLVLWSLLPGALLGVLLLVMERCLAQVKVYLYNGMGRLLTGFLLFFFYLICYLALASLVFSFPLGYVMEQFLNKSGLAVEYSLFSVNFFIVLAVANWLRNLRSEPYRCFSPLTKR